MSLQKLKSKVEIEQFQIRADLVPSSYNKKNNSVEVVMSSGYRGKRYDFMSGGYYYEELEISEAAIDTVRLEKGIPCLMNHDQYGRPAGVVDSFRIENGLLKGTIRFSATKSFEEIVQDVEAGILKDVSLGYRVHKYADVTTPTDDAQVLRAVLWEPMEVSLVCVPFDPDAHTREASKKHSAIIITRNEGETMPDPEKPEAEKPAAVAEGEKPAEGAPSPEAPAAEEKPAASEAPAEGSEQAEKPAAEEKKEESKDEVRMAERLRNSSILEIVRKADLETSYAEELMKTDISVEQARAAVIDKLAERGAKPLSNKTEITVGQEQVDVQKRGIVDALLHRADPKAFPLTEQGRLYRGMRMIELAREVLESSGVKTRGMVPAQIADKVMSRDFHTRAGFHGTTDFASLLADVANKTLRQAYEQSPQTFRPFVRATTASDFKNINRVQLGEAPVLEKVLEHGNLQYGTIGDGKELYKILSYAKGLKFTRQAMINDDTDAFSRLATLMGRAAANLESDLIYQILNANAAMQDTVALFHASHGNLATAEVGAPDQAAINELMLLASKQTGLNGAILNIILQYIVVPPEHRLAALQVVSPVNAQQVSNVNPFAGMFQVIVEPRLSVGTASPSSSGSTTAWFGIASPSQIDTIEIASLEGQAGPMIVEDVDFDTQGIKMAIWHDVGAKAIDHRGMVKNAGA